MINNAELDILRHCLDTLSEGFADLPEFTVQFDVDAATAVLKEAATRMQDNYPYHHPQYAGQMLKPPHPVARIAYALSLWINPNNPALDGGRASSAMEKECIEHLGRMFGWDSLLGHLTGGGTMANLEALWVASKLHPGKRVVASSQAHYTHSRLTSVLGIPFTPVDVTRDGIMHLAHLERLLETGDVGTIVATPGTTGLGSVDPITDIVALARQYGARVHADAAYGGYFTLATELAPTVRSHFDAIREVDSIVIDPHKHGLQPYGCGCVLFRDPSVGQFYKHGSPYTYFSSAELHLGEISLECSRPGAAAVALWATQQLIPSQPGGKMTAIMDSCLRAAIDFWHRLDRSDQYQTLMQPELDIVVYAPKGDNARTISRRSQEIFDDCANNGLHLALIALPVDFIQAWLPNVEANDESVTVLRSVLMKPEQVDWVDRIVAILEDAASRSPVA